MIMKHSFQVVFFHIGHLDDAGWHDHWIGLTRPCGNILKHLHRMGSYFFTSIDSLSIELWMRGKKHPIGGLGPEEAIHPPKLTTSQGAQHRMRALHTRCSMYAIHSRRPPAENLRRHQLEPWVVLRKPAVTQSALVVEEKLNVENKGFELRSRVKSSPAAGLRSQQSKTNYYAPRH